MKERASNRRVGLVTIVLILSVAVGPALGAIASPSATQLGSGPVSQQGVDTDSVRLIVSVEENGSATWTVQYWTRLDDENTTAAFESLQRDIEATPSNFSDRFASRMRSTVRASENATGREMAATGFDVTAETRTPPDYGVIVYTFRWDGFAAVDGDTVRVGDAIEGLFLDDRTRLVIEWPTEYTTTDITPEPDERRTDAVVWRGAETSFVSGEPSVALRPASVDTTSGGDGGTGGDGDGAGEYYDKWTEGLVVLGQYLPDIAPVGDSEDVANLREELYAAARTVELEERRRRSGDLVKASPKEEIKERLGRSPDRLDAMMMAAWAAEGCAPDDSAGEAFLITS